MSVLDVPYLSATDIDEEVLGILRDFERDDGVTYGKILDLGAVVKDSPLKRLDIRPSRVDKQSLERVENAVAQGTYGDVILLAVEMPAGPVIIDCFSSNEESEFRHISDVSGPLGYSQRSLDQLRGEWVPVEASSERCRVVTPREAQREISFCEAGDFIWPAIFPLVTVPIVSIGVLVNALSFIVGFGLTVIATLVAVVCYYILFSLRFGYQFTEIVPNWLSRGNTGGGESTDELAIGDGVVDIQFGEFQGLMIESEESPSQFEGSILLRVAVNVPDVGTFRIPLRVHEDSWTDSTLKRVVYDVALSVDQLETANDDVLPLQYEKGRLSLDVGEIVARSPEPSYPKRERIVREVLSKIHRYRDVKTPSELFA